MRRAAVVAIALVVVLLLLLLGRTDWARTTRREAPKPKEFDEPGTTPTPETAAAVPGGANQAEAVGSGPDTIASGHVVDADGKPLAGLRLLAIPRDNTAMWDAEDPCTPPGADPPVPFAHSGGEGAFAFHGLPRGEYRLAIDEDWTLVERFTFRADAAGLHAVATRVTLAEVEAVDLATKEPIPRFVVRYRWPWNAPEERVEEASGGVFRTRLRMGVEWPGYATFRVEALGYYGGWASCMPAKGRAWLVRAEEPRLTLRIVFEDGAPCEEEADVYLERRDGRCATLPATAIGSGRYRVAVPTGGWHLDFRPHDSLVFCKECTSWVDLEEGERSEVFLELERGSDIVLRRKGWDGKPWGLQANSKAGGMFWTPVYAETYRMRHVTAGTYSFSFADSFAAAFDPSGTRVWHREIEVTNGSRHELTIE